jgi:hypothetical protein
MDEKYPSASKSTLFDGVGLWKYELKRFSAAAGYSGRGNKKRQNVALDCYFCSNNGRSAMAVVTMASLIEPAITAPSAVPQKLVRRPTSTLRPGAGAMSRKIELA